MKFVCDRCQTKYSIADEKVRGKVLKVRCKTCQNVITVREAGAKPSQNALAPVRSSQKPSGAHAAPLAEVGEHDEQSERTSIAPAPAGLMADLLQGQLHGRRPTPPPPPPLGDGVEWFLALDGAQQGPFARRALVDHLLALPKSADVHVWNEKMDGWKSPRDVPEVAHDLSARRPPAVPTRPPIPRATPSPPLPATAARRGTQPLSSGVGSKLPLPPPHVAAAHAVPAPHTAIDPSQPTPNPVPGHGGSNGAKTNGVAAHGAAPVAPFPHPESDALSALNIGRAKSGPLRIMEFGEATAWSGAGRVQEGRHRNTKMVFALLSVVCVIIVVAVLNMTRKAPAVTLAPPIKAGLDSEALGKLHELAAAEKNEPPASPPEVAREEPPVPSPVRGGKAGRVQGALRGRPLLARARTTPGTPAAGAVSAPAAEDANAARFRESGGRVVTPGAAILNRPAPSQAEITRVIANNKIGIKTCYQRALLRDSNLTHGKIVVGVTIGLSGRVKGVRVDAPSSFRALEPCIKEMVGRWTFPQSYEEYGTEFSYLFQGNE
ncbi:MAG TPA: AgmX/PglI C-terminal domain-containing protein [Polyangia bacterium]|nr:AgmX/PglI C-terminal domain-containing protein [Polyangia bacterium]